MAKVSKLNSWITILFVGSALLSTLLCFQGSRTLIQDNSLEIGSSGEKPHSWQAIPSRPIPAFRRGHVPVKEEDEMARWFASTNVMDRQFAKTNLFPNFVSREPIAAAHFAESLLEGSDRLEVLRQVAESWGSGNAVQALRWAESLLDIGEQQAATIQICFQISKVDPARAVSIAREQSVDPGAVGGMLQNWAEKNFFQATEWIASLPPGNERDRLNARAAFVRSQTDPATAAKFIAEKIPAGDVQTEAAISVLHQWALKDVAAASTWASQFGKGQVGDRAKKEIEGVVQAKLASHR